MNVPSYRVIALFIAVVLVVLGVIFLSPVFRSGASSGTTTGLAAVEVRSYQGQDLSSISDVSENAIAGTQYINESDYQLMVTGLTLKTENLTYREILDNHQHYSKVVTLDCVEGWSAKILWEGVLVRDLINEAGVDPRANTVIFHATDGYTTSFPLSYVMDNDIIIAYKMNNVTLPAANGFPLRLVAEDKWGYKWIKWIDEIELSDNPNYQGYWEQRGYSESGNLSESQYS
ncbi:MAG: molybdopterin-dependent oxidoreductase [Methanoregula sp.]|jgi:DMSO/TMAO reductase YedYZ molybdopterin-dependent catalytic subunit|uniref:molybdopterin-dependent oxidoreductase n=1 Tax=Methanoregula sp. TaxID=2052170 RepID=UPI003C730219